MNNTDINRAAPSHVVANPDAFDATIDDMFEYHKWTDEQVAQGKDVRKALADAVKVIIRNVPASPDRTVAIRKIREARMDCNSAITHSGKY